MPTPRFETSNVEETFSPCGPSFIYTDVTFQQHFVHWAKDDSHSASSRMLRATVPILSTNPVCASTASSSSGYNVDSDDRVRLDMGKSCVRFRRLEDLPLRLIGEAVSWSPMEEWIRCYESLHPVKRSAGSKRD